MFDSKVDFEVKSVFGDHLKHYVFSINSHKYVMDVINSENSDYLRISFTLAGKGTGIYATGNSFSVFSAVFYILQEIMHTTGKNKLSFASALNLPSRVKLYDRLCKTFVLQKKALSWSFEDDSKYREYELTFNA
jgi:hypothetical protein